MNISDNLSSVIKFIPRKNRTDSSKYTIYIGFYVSEKGITMAPYDISTGIDVEVKQWDHGKVIGRGDKVTLINDTLKQMEQKANDMLTDLRLKKIHTYSELLKELKINARQRILNKAPRGQKQAFISKLKEYDYLTVMKLYLNDNPSLSKGRVNNYYRTYRLLKEYFDNNIPSIDQITKEHLTGLQDWIVDTFENQNTQTTYLAKYGTILSYAVDKGLINHSPLPKNFRGSFVDAHRESLSEDEVLAVQDLIDSNLTSSQQVAKYCLLFQATTGIGYGDMLSISHEHIKTSTVENRQYIQKERNKTKVEFCVYLSANAKYIKDRLSFLTGTTEQPFGNLPSLSYTSRLYKELAKLAEIEKNIATYTLRHTYATNRMQHGGTLEDLQKELGHKDISTTQIYAKINHVRQVQKSIEHESKSKMHQLLKAV